MNRHGFFRVAAATHPVKVAGIDANVDRICERISQAAADEVSVVVFPELGVTSYTAADLFGQDALLDAAEEGIMRICQATAGTETVAVVGVPVRFRNRLYNCAAVISGGSLHGLVPKTYLPTYNEFYESRWFASSSELGERGAEVCYAGFDVLMSPFQLFDIGGVKVAVEICEDLWVPVPPSSFHALAGADVIVNLSASNEVLGKHDYRKSLVSNQSARTISGYVYSSSAFGESSQDMVYAGAALIYENGSKMAEAERFTLDGGLLEADLDIQKLRALRRKQTTFGMAGGMPFKDYWDVPVSDGAATDFAALLLRCVEPHPFIPSGDDVSDRCREILSTQISGLATRLSHIGCKTAVIGISGGLDSTLALLVSVLAADKLGWDRSRIVGITMPGFGTTSRTHGNAVALMDALGVTSEEISIARAVEIHFEDIGQDPSRHDVTYENCQARERTQILMDYANRTGGIVVGTGDLSELALGWATYNGDHMSMYAVNAGVPKTLVKYLVQWASREYFSGGPASGAGDILEDIVSTPISPELIPAAQDGGISQKTEDIVGPYELHDFFLYHVFRYGASPSKVEFLARKAFLEQERTDGFLSPEGSVQDYSPEVIRKWLKVFFKRFFAQQFKRSCLPDCPKVGSVTLSPRGDWRMPSDAVVSSWLKELE